MSPVFLKRLSSFAQRNQKVRYIYVFSIFLKYIIVTFPLGERAEHFRSKHTKKGGACDFQLGMYVSNTYNQCMRLTLNIDGDLLDRVVESTGSKTKTEAITFALNELDRRRRLTEKLRRGSGASPEELETMFDPASDPMILRVAERQSPYGDISS